MYDRREPERVPLKIDILKVVLGSKHGPAKQSVDWPADMDVPGYAFYFRKAVSGPRDIF